MSIRNFSEISHQRDSPLNHSYANTCLVLLIYGAESPFGCAHPNGLSQDREQQSKRRRTNTNARFDKMMETMSVVHTHAAPSRGSASSDTPHTNKKGRRVTTRDTHSHPVPSTLERDISFIKMNRLPPNHSSSSSSDLPSSDTADTVSKVTSSYSYHSYLDPSSLFKLSTRRRTCNPLPTWLANTFMSLSRKHPLRLLLPPGIQSAITGPTNEINSIPQDVHSDSVDDKLPFNKPDLSADIDHNTTCQPIPDSQLSLLTKSIVQSANDAVYDTNSNAPVFQDVPFSIPGPGRRSVLGSSTESTVLFSRSPLRTPSSPTVYEDSRSGLDLRLVDPHTFCNSSDSGRVMNDRVQNDCSVEPDALTPDLADNTLFSEIYATPGPGYYSSRPIPIYYDYPDEDPLGSPLGDSFGIPYDEIDFKWQSFDRTNLVAPNVSTRAAFAYGPGESIDFAFYDEHVPIETNPGITLLQGLEYPLSPAANEHSRAATASPCPFRFLPPPEGEPNRAPAIVPETKGPASTTAMAPQEDLYPSAHVPGFTPQVQLPHVPKPLSGFNITGRGTNRSPSQLTHVATTGLTNLPTQASESVEDNDDNDANIVCSQASNDSIESWGYVGKQNIM